MFVNEEQIFIMFYPSMTFCVSISLSRSAFTVLCLQLLISDIALESANSQTELKRLKSL